MLKTQIKSNSYSATKHGGWVQTHFRNAVLTFSKLLIFIYHFQFQKSTIHFLFLSSNSEMKQNLASRFYITKYLHRTYLLLSYFQCVQNLIDSNTDKILKNMFYNYKNYIYNIIFSTQGLPFISPPLYPTTAIPQFKNGHTETALTGYIQRWW